MRTLPLRAVVRPAVTSLLCAAAALPAARASAAEIAPASRPSVAVVTVAALPAATAATPGARVPAARVPAAGAPARPRPFLTAVADVDSATAWRTFHLVGRLSPPRPGERILVQRRLPGGQWRAFPAATRVRADGTFTCAIRSGRRGLNEFRLLRHGHAGAATIVSNTAPIRIR